ncbi:HTH-type transcriptional regulator YesS [compost metagenome]
MRRYLKISFQVAHSGPHEEFTRLSDVVGELRSTTLEQEAADSNACLKDSVHTIDVALQYIRAHYTEDLSLERVASVVFLNPVYFSQLFKQKTGQGYKDYVISLRMEEAKNLLLQPQLKLADIAEKIGYHDMRHFTQVFRRKCGMTPTEYRASSKLR